MHTTQKTDIVYAAIVLALLHGCLSMPPEDAGLAPDQTAIISGDALVMVPLDEPHPVVLFLTEISFDDNGSPVYSTANLTVISEDLLSQGGADLTASTGPFTFPQVYPGYYTITGIVDMDENFNPLVAELAAPTEGDIGGGYIDLTTGQLIVVEVGDGDILEEVNVIFST